MAPLLIYFYFNCYLILHGLLLVNALEKEMTINVEAGREDCFYETLKAGQTLEVDYQVIDGGQGELDINFRLINPSGVAAVVDYKKPDNTHRIDSTEAGDYRMCWDNSFSTFSAKTIFFEIIIDPEEGLADPWDDADGYDGLTPEEKYEMEIQAIEEVVLRVRTNLNKVQHIQELTRAFEARDRNVAESNYVRVNMWSAVQIIVMIVVGFIQVVMLKSLFDEKSCIHQFWKKVFTS